MPETGWRHFGNVQILALNFSIKIVVTLQIGLSCRSFYVVCKTFQTIQIRRKTREISRLEDRVWQLSKLNYKKSYLSCFSSDCYELWWFCTARWVLLLGKFSEFSVDKPWRCDIFDRSVVDFQKEHSASSFADIELHNNKQTANL